MTLPDDPQPNLPPAKWPTVLGILAIIFGGMGALSLPMAFAQGAITRFSLNTYVKAGTASQEQVDAYLDKWVSFQTMSSLGWGCIAIVLLAGGIFTLKRRKPGPLLLKVWSLLMIILMPVSTYFSSRMMVEQMVFQMPAEEEGMEAFMKIMESVMSIIPWVGLAIFLIVPIVLLIWLSRANVKWLVKTWN